MQDQHGGTGNLRQSDEHADPQVPAVSVRAGVAGPDLARAAPDARADVVLRRSARRQPGADRPDGRGAQEGDVGSPRPARLQGDRGRLPICVPARLGLHAPPDRGGPRPGRRLGPGAHTVPRGADRPDDRERPRCEEGDRPPVQLDLGAPAPGRVPRGPAGDRRHRGHRRQALPRCARPAARDRDPLRVLPRELHRHRAGLRSRDLRAGARRLAAPARPEGDLEPASDRRADDAERLRRPVRVVREKRQPAGLRDPLDPSAQRPRLRRRRHGARTPRGRRARRRSAVRQRRAHRQRRHRHPGAEPVHARNRPRPRLLRHRRGPPRRRVLQPAARAHPPSVRR